MKLTMAILLAGLGCGVVQAQTFFDDFNRADTVANTDPAVSIGAGWINAGEAGALSRIYSNELDIVSGGTNPSVGNILLHSGIKTLNDGAQSEFTLSATVRLDSLNNTAFAGLVFNYVSNKNCYLLRYNGQGAVQLIRRRDGFADSTALNVAGFTHVQNRPYRITVSSSTAYRYDITIRDTVTDTVVYSNTYFWAALELYEDGLGGVYGTTGLAACDDVDFSYLVPSATAVSDGFSRADTAAAAADISIGTNWLNGASAGNGYRIFGKKADVVSGASPWLLLNTELDTLNDGTGTNFMLLGTVKLNTTSDSGCAGLVFNYQDANNYYAFRYGGGGLVQVLRVIGGSVSTLVSTGGAFSHTANRPYELMVSSADPYAFEISIRDTVDDIVVYSNNAVSDSLGSFKDGSGGFYANNGGVLFDDYWLDSTGAPKPPSAYNQWAASYGLTGGQADDDDGDGLLNLYEYGLTGDPTNSADQGVSPVFAIVDDAGTSYFSYVHPQLAGPDSGVAYSLELNTGLVSGTWTNAGYAVLGTNDTGGELDFVTNLTSTAEDTKFIRLIIESL